MNRLTKIRIVIEGNITLQLKLSIPWVSDLLEI